MMINRIIKNTSLVLLLSAFFTTTLLFVPQSVSTDEVAEAVVANAIYYSADAYSDEGEMTVINECFDYHTKTSTPIVQVNSSFPAYFNKNMALTNCCANTAGANLIGYYDRYCENLIPNFVPGRQRGSTYSYYPMGSSTSMQQLLINDLYTRMNTNLTEAGTTQEEYKRGISSYVSSAGYCASFYSVMTNSTLDMNKMYWAIDKGYPVSLSLSGYNISKVEDMDGRVSITKYSSTGNHIMVVYGYNSVNYYDVFGSLLKSHTYLYVATGKEQIGCYILNNNDVINEAIAVQIN